MSFPSFCCPPFPIYFPLLYPLFSGKTITFTCVLLIFCAVYNVSRDREKDPIRDPFLKVMYDKYVCVVG